MENCPECGSDKIGFFKIKEVELPETDETEIIGYHYCQDCDWQEEIS